MPQSVVHNGKFKKVGYTCSDLQDSFALMGLARYGTQDYLPVGVAGSFEGASRILGQRVLPMVVEGDGTVVMLRNATNGITYGAYYSYMPTSEDGVVTGHFPTNSRYQPKFLGSRVARTVGRGSPGVFVGVSSDADNQNSKLFITLTSGTMNQDLHTGCEITGLSIPNLALLTPVIDQSTVYLILHNGTNNLQFTVYSVSVAAVQGGGSVAVTPVSGWTTKRPWSTDVVNNANIVLTTAASSLNNSGSESYISTPGSGITVDNVYQSGIYISAASDGAGKIRILTGAEQYIVNSALASNRAYWALSFVIDVVAKTATPDTGVTLPMVVTSDTSGGNFTGPLYQPRETHDGAANGNNFSSTAYGLVKKRAYTYSTPNQGVAQMFTSKLVGDYASVFAVLMYNRKMDRVNIKQMADMYGSAVGGELRKPQWLPGNKLLSYGLINPTPGVSAYGWTLSQLGADGYNYTTLAGTLLGFAPTIDRKYVSTAEAVAYGISDIAANGAITYSPAQLNATRYSCPQYLDGNLQPVNDTVISVAQSLLNSAGSAVFSAAGITGSSGIVTSLYVPQNPNIPAIIHIVARDTTANTDWSIVGTCTLDTRTGAITAITNVTYLTKWQIGGTGQGTGIDLHTPGMGMTIYEGTDCWFVSFGHRYHGTYVGNSHTAVWRGIVAKSAPGAFVSGSLVATTDVTYLSNDYTPFAVPGWGFGYVDGVLGNGIGGTAIIFRSTGKTIAEYNSWTVTGTKMLLSQMVAQGWIVYFTEETPLLSENGKTYHLPITTIDLTTIKANPASSTFYAYVQVVSDTVAEYVISTTPLTETTALFHIGNVVTNATQIDSHTIAKTTMFGGKHLSPLQRGNSIPVSSGNPASGTGEYLW